MSTLFELHRKYNSVKTRDKYPYSHTYAKDIYPKHLDGRKNDPLTVVEIGIARGGALQALRDYLPNARIIGYDVQLVDLQIEDYTRIELLQGSQDDPVRLKDLIDTFGPFDVIIDDACHLFEPQLASFTALWPHLNPGGMYFIEDVFPLWGKRGNASDRIFHHVKENLLKAEEFAKKGAITDKHCISFYPSMIVLEKAK